MVLGFNLNVVGKTLVAADHGCGTLQGGRTLAGGRKPLFVNVIHADALRLLGRANEHRAVVADQALHRSR